MTEQRDIVAELRELHREIVESDDGESEMMRKVREGFEEIERLRAQVATADQENERLRGENFRIAETLSEYAKEYEERRLPGERVPTHDAAGNKLPTPSEWFGRDAPPESSAKEPS